MSLIAWYPLNGDMKNYGLGDMNLSVSTDPTFTDSGKIGKGLSSGGAAVWTAEQTASILNNDELSICFWIKVVDVDNRKMIFGNDAMDANNNRKFSLFRYPTANDLHWSWMNDAKSTTFTSGILYNAFPTGKWVHCTVTYKNPIGSIYINGVLKQTFTAASASSSFEYPTQVIRECSGVIMNDYRFYNHCLSVKEVKEISKALILHYPMNEIDGVIGGRNLLKDSNIDIRTTYNSPTNGFTINLADTSNIQRFIGKKMSFSYNILRKGPYNAGSGSFGDRYGAHGVCNWINSSTGAKTRSYPFAESLTIKDNKRVEMTVTLNPPARYDTLESISFSVQLYAKPTVDNTEAPEWKFSYPKFEIGDATPWTPAPEDFPILEDNVVYDASGYGNNGTYTDESKPEWDSDTIVGQGSYNLNGDKFIKSEFTGSLSEFSCSFWIKPSSKNYNYSIVVSNYNRPNGGFWIATNCEGSGLWFYVGQYCEYSTLLPNDIWSHACFVFNNGNCKWYLNGIKVYETQISLTSVPTHELTIGNSYTGTSWGTKQYGSISDFRLYTTALSDSDIEELYKTRFSIADNGVLYCTEYVEDESAPSFKENGILLSSNLSEKINLYDMDIKKLSDGSVWAKVFNHNNQSGTKLFSNSNDFENSPVIIDEDRYSRLNIIKNFMSDGVYEFLVNQPDDGNGYWRWTQTNNPVTSTSAGTVNFIEGTSTYNNGLMKSNSSATFLARSTSNTNWWCAVGSWTKYGNGIPGFGDVAVQGRLEMWVRIDKLLNQTKTQIYSDSIVSNEVIER